MKSIYSVLVLVFALGLATQSLGAKEESALPKDGGANYLWYMTHKWVRSAFVWPTVVLLVVGNMALNTRDKLNMRGDHARAAAQHRFAIHCFKGIIPFVGAFVIQNYGAVFHLPKQLRVDKDQN